MKIFKIAFICLWFISAASIAHAQNVVVQSPNKKISVTLFNSQNAHTGSWNLKVSYSQLYNIDDSGDKLILGTKYNL
jgi:hypothetical protein